MLSSHLRAIRSQRIPLFVTIEKCFILVQLKLPIRKPMSRHQAGLALTVLTLALTACQPQDVEPAQKPVAATPDASASTHTEPTAVPAEPRLISLEPASMPTCDAAEVVAKWDVRAKHPDVTSIEIWVGFGTETKVWIASTPFGEAPTGPWTTPGAVFILKNQATGDELARTIMQGPACQ